MSQRARCIALSFLVAVLWATTSAPAQQETCVRPCDFFPVADATDRPTIDLPTPMGSMITITQSTLPLRIVDCPWSVDCNVAVFVPYSRDPPLASIAFPPGLCPGTNYPPLVRITVIGHSDSPELRAYDAASVLVDQGSVPSGPPGVIQLSNPSGIARLEIFGDEICISEICWGCCELECDRAKDFLTAQANAVPQITFGRVTVDSAVEGGVGDLLRVMDCAGDGGWNVFVLSSLPGVASPPAMITLAQPCKGGTLPGLVVVRIKSDNGELRALDASMTVQDSADMTLGLIPPARPVYELRNYELEYTGGIAKVEIYGTQHCIESVCWWCAEAAVQFVRGDCDADGNVNIADAVRILNYIFRGGPPCNCLDAGDADDNGALNIVDPIRLLCWLFGTCPPLPAPTPVDSLGTPAGSYDPVKSCGSDPTADALGCASFGACP